MVKNEIKKTKTLLKKKTRKANAKRRLKLVKPTKIEKYMSPVALAEKAAKAKEHIEKCTTCIGTIPITGHTRCDLYIAKRCDGKQFDCGAYQSIVAYVKRKRALFKGESAYIQYPQRDGKII